jgi:hypothetical protein
MLYFKVKIKCLSIMNTVKFFSLEGKFETFSASVQAVHKYFELQPGASLLQMAYADSGRFDLP